MGTIDHPGFRDPLVRVGGGGALERAFFLRRPGANFSLVAWGNDRREATRRDAGAGRRAGAPSSRSPPRSRRSRRRPAARPRRAPRVSSSEDDPPERRGARSVASAGAGSSAAARGAATIAIAPRRAYRCFPALGGVEGCEDRPRSGAREGAPRGCPSRASMVEARRAGRCAGGAERRVRGTRPEVAAKTTTSDDGIDRRFREATSRKSETGGRFRLHYFKTVPRAESRLSQQGELGRDDAT